MQISAKTNDNRITSESSNLHSQNARFFWWLLTPLYRSLNIFLLAYKHVEMYSNEYLSLQTSFKIMKIEKEDVTKIYVE